MREGVIQAGICLLLACNVASGTGREEGHNFPAGSGGVNAPHQQGKPYVVLVSIDGFRWDWPDVYPITALEQIAADGVRAERLLPVWPTLTFPNHFTLVTGRLPAEHGLTANTFWSPDVGLWYRIHDRETVQNGAFYTAEPLWVTAEKQGMVAASYFWVGSEAPILSVRPTHWRSYDKRVPGVARVDQALQWLSEPRTTRPHFITLYFEDVDDHAHWNGPGSESFNAALERVNRYLLRLMGGIEELPHGDDVYLIVVSDHGQLTYEDAPPFVLDAHIDPAGLHWVDGGPYVFAWFRDPEDVGRADDMVDAVNRVWSDGTAYTRASAPAAWKVTDDRRFPDLIFQAHPGRAVLSTIDMRGKMTAGDHGWPPEAPGMHGILLIHGPGIPAGARIGPVSAVDVHPFILEVLGLGAPGSGQAGAGALSGLLSPNSR